jgi:hypothetical protein
MHTRRYSSSVKGEIAKAEATVQVAQKDKIAQTERQRENVTCELENSALVKRKTVQIYGM